MGKEEVYSGEVSDLKVDHRTGKSHGNKQQHQHSFILDVCRHSCLQSSALSVVSARIQICTIFGIWYEHVGCNFHLACFLLCESLGSTHEVCLEVK